jgi:hypothetical protein
MAIEPVQPGHLHWSSFIRLYQAQHRVYKKIRNAYEKIAKLMY